MTTKEYNTLSYRIIKCAIEVHKVLGPGLLESVYDVCLSIELQRAGLSVERQKILPAIYKEHDIQKDYIIDQIVDNKIIVELKSIEKILPVHEAQLLTYLKLSGKRLGLLINFNVPVLKDGVRRKINGNLDHQ